MARAARRLRPETELSRVKELLDQADRTAGSTVLLAERLPPRRQKKLRNYKKRTDGKLGIELDTIAAEFAGKHLLFQLRDDGQIAGTATWHTPGEPPRAPEVARVADAPDTEPERGERRPPDAGFAGALAELSTFAEVRAENKLLAEEVRGLRTTVGRLQMDLATARAEGQEAVRARKQVEAQIDAMRKEQSDSEAVLWVLRERLGAGFNEVVAMVRGR